MIRVTTFRTHGGVETLRNVDEYTPQDALRLLVDDDLGWGGQIVRATPTTVETIANAGVYGDGTIFEGDAEEMRTIYSLAAFRSALPYDHKI